MSARKRLNLSLSEKDYNAINALAKRCGFNGACALVCALIEVYCDYAAKYNKEPRTAPAIAEEIKRMFDLLEEWGTLPDNSNLTIKTNINQRK